MTAFTSFAPSVSEPTELRARIRDAYRRAEQDCVRPLLDEADLPDEVEQSVEGTAHRLVEAIRNSDHGHGIDGLVTEYALSSQEGVALMCLAEALLRIPDAETRDRLIKDKIAPGDWRSHLGGDRPMFVNAATWGLILTGRLVQPVKEKNLGSSLTRLIGRAGEPVIRQAVDLAMRLLGEQFVIGETIEKALKRAKKQEARGFRYSYDMLGEAAVTAQDADDYMEAYRHAIHAIGKSATGDDIYSRPGISIKLSALHPRYERTQVDRVMEEMLPRARELAVLAKGYNIGLNIDAEEADRLEMSLDVLEALAFDEELADWDGLGFVIQAYGKRCPFIVDWIVDLARRSGHRFMVRLVKGAYWDMEIKRAQLDGLSDYPVYTRKSHTDVAYQACAQRLLNARDAVFPQFATHNARSLAAIHHRAGPDFTIGDYEYQCLHGMGEPLYDEVINSSKLSRPCRIYAPVGTHETLLAYLVRRLLENGANSSFVNQIADRDIDLDALIADPVKKVRSEADPGAPHPMIALPEHMFADRDNSRGIDPTDETTLGELDESFRKQGDRHFVAGSEKGAAATHDVTNPGDMRDIVGTVHDLPPESAAKIVQTALDSKWSSLTDDERSACLDRAADAMEAEMPELLPLIMREAGKTLPNAVAEIREAVDFLRYYAVQARDHLVSAAPLGPVVCISPWNFPLAIFTGQVAAALVAGNPALAKPAEETTLIAAEAVRILHEAGVPEDALQLVPGDGSIGAALVDTDGIGGVMFTGSTEVAKLIQRQLAERLLEDGHPIPLIAETGGQNAMIVDSSALAEQVVADVIASAFDSAGQRCSALRILCIQEEVADRTIAMLRGAMDELKIGPTDEISCDVGPVISETARDNIENHIEKMRDKGHRVYQPNLPEACAHGTYVAPTLIEIDSIEQLGPEVFGPVLHVLRYKMGTREQLIERINATGYGLTFGLHSRLDSAVDRLLKIVGAGNRYVNRNMIGAVVGVQPFGGHGMSGTGPKAGGPLYLGRLVQGSEQPFAGTSPGPDPALSDFADWLDEKGMEEAAETARIYGAASPVGLEIELPGPVGERNFYALRSRGTLLLNYRSEAGFRQQLAVTLASGNLALIAEGCEFPDDLPQSVRDRIAPDNGSPVSAALYEGDQDGLIALQRALVDRQGAVLTVQAATPEECAAGLAYRGDWLCDEVSTSIDITAAGGNASLMALAD